MKNNKVIYTAIFGGKDCLREPLCVPTGFDFVCFTDDTSLISSVWKIYIVDPPFQDPVRCARQYKILAHKFLSKYETSVWIDGNMVVVGDVNRALQEYLNGNAIAVYNHAFLKKRILGLFWVVDHSFARDCVYDEAVDLIRRTESGTYMDDPVVILRQMDRYRNTGYPSHNGLVSTMVLYRRHLDPKVVSLMEYWWNEVSQGSRRDQLSFNYSAWKLSMKPKLINEDSRYNKYFTRVRHTKKENPK